MHTDIKQILPIMSTVLLLVISVAVQARDYVPPPSGPYQPLVVINNSPADESQQQVYKFPPPDILLEDRNTRPGGAYQSDHQIDEPGAQIAPAMVEPPMNQPQQVMEPQRIQPMPQASGYSQWQMPQQGGQAGTNPGWYGYQGSPQNYNQNVWQQQPGYGYQQQYPYSYGAPNQYNGANTPFYGMPSPWTVMPKTPFFSDK
jgi:hypothetical protein